MKKHIIISLSLLLIATTVGAAPKAKKPKNFAEIFGKNWTLEKVIYRGKDMTAELNGKMTRGVLVFTFAEDGKMTTTDPEVVVADWKFNDRGLNIHMENKPTPETPAGAPGPGGTIFYQIKKLTADTLVLEMPGLKPGQQMTMTFTAK